MLTSPCDSCQATCTGGRLSPVLCNGDDRRQRRKQGGVVGAAACRMRVPPKARSRRREPQSELIEFTKHSLSAPRMEKGSATSITQVLAQYNKKALPELPLRGGCFCESLTSPDCHSPTLSICNPAQKSSRQIKINNLPLEWPAKTPADRGKSVNGGQGDV